MARLVDAEPTSRNNRHVANPDRLSALDATFLHLEDHGPAHMHVASVMVFEGETPTADELIEHLNARMHLVPRYRQRLAYVPLEQGRPVWTDDPHYNPRYHVRHTALPRPGDDATLQRLAGRLFSQRLDRSKPLWEIWLVDRLDRGRFAVICKTHHALVDGVSGVDITSILFDVTRTPPPPLGRIEAWAPQPLPGAAKLLADALVERTTIPGEMVRGLRRAVRAPRRLIAQAREGLVGLGATALAGISDPAPASPFNVDIGSHRRYTWLDAELSQFKAIKNALGGTLNDVVLTTVALALGDYLRSTGHDTTDLVLKAMVPVSVRDEQQRGALGNRVAAVWAPLPVGSSDAVSVFEEIHLAMDEIKQSGQAVGAQALTELAGLAPPTIASQAARLQERQRFFNLVVTNIPGPQLPLYLLGRELIGLYPVVPLARRQALGIAIMSYNGRLGFGLLADFDALPDLEAITDSLRGAIDSLARSAGVAGKTRFTSRRRVPPSRLTRP